MVALPRSRTGLRPRPCTALPNFFPERSFPPEGRASMIQRSTGTPYVTGGDVSDQGEGTAAPQQPEERRGLIGRLMRRNRLLTDREAELRAREAELLDRLSAALERFGP